MTETQTSQRRLARPPIDDVLIGEITRRIVEGVHPNRIVLFGSRARGDHRPDSDIDIMVEMESDENRFERYKRVNKLFRGRWWAMDLLVYTPEEVAARQNSLVSIVPIIE